MLKKIFIINILILSFCTMHCWANEPKQVNLKTAIEIAEKNNLDLKSSEKNIDIAKNEIKIANRLQNPYIKTFFNFGQAGKGNPNQIGLAETVELFKRAPRKKLAEVNYNLSSAELEYQIFNLKMDVAEAYVKLVVAKSILKKYEHQQKFLEKLLEISNLNNSNNTPDLDTIEAKLALNQIITEVNKVRTNAKTARIEFNRIINSPDGNYDAVDTELSNKNDIIGINIPTLSVHLPPFKDIENSAINNRYDIKIAQKQIDLAKQKLTVVVRQRVPDIELSSGYTYQTIGLSDSNKFLSGSYLEASLVNIPLFYTYKPEIKNAQLEIEKANINYISTVNKAKKSVEIAYERFINAHLNLENYNDKILKESEDLFTLFEEKYKVENVDFATLAAVEESYQDLVSGYSEALSDYYISWINFLRETYSEDFKFNNQTL